MRFIFLVLCSFVSTCLSSRTLVIGISQNHISGSDRSFVGIRGGDTLLLSAGLRGAIQFSDLHGGTDRYITIINDTGLSVIKSAQLPYGISFRNCSYIKLSGAGNRRYKYGIMVAEVSRPGAGIGVSSRTDNFEMNNVEVCHINGPGILCKTEPDCGLSAENYTQYNTTLHDNYIHHTGTEGMYIGSSAFSGVWVRCDSARHLTMPPLLCNVSIYDNVVEYTGWDGIQVGNAINVKCYHNTILYASQKNEEWQNCGLIIGGGAAGTFRDNYIAHGKGYGINCFGRDKVNIEGNTIVMDSAQDRCAIYLSDKLADKRTTVTVRHNRFMIRYQPWIKTSNKKYGAAFRVSHNTVKAI